MKTFIRFVKRFPGIISKRPRKLTKEQIGSLELFIKLMNLNCEKCGGEITSRDDLVVSNTFLSIVPYHEKCFSKELKRPIYHMPEDVEILLKEADLMERYKITPSYQQNDYIRWINRAKRPETREKRIE